VILRACRDAESQRRYVEGADGLIRQAVEVQVMATGWAGDGAVQQQIDDSVEDAIRRARAQLPAGPGASHCMECGETIPEARRLAMPGVRLCVDCQAGHDREQDAALNLYNRRGSKDSQLR
jgi:phage/conjugal plasmid C-4 type zinc finger TraR family protein